jgi:hypothetical protein
MRFRDLAAPCLALFLLSSVLLGQDYRARVQGIVTDASQAAIPGANVTLRNLGTGTSKETTTSEIGQYLFDFVEPGEYSLTVEASGMTRFVQERFGVQVRGDVTINASLSVGNVTEQVTVSGQAAEVKFNTSSVDLTIDRKMLTDLPILGRNPFRLALLDPLVVDRGWGANNPFDMWGAQTINIGGSTSSQNDLLLDGAPLQMTNKASYAPPMDTVQEYTIQQNSVDAEYGNSAGGSMSLSTKSGTNDIHGTAYYFGRNPALNALSNRIARTENFVRNHIYGGSVGNPIIKNKLFNFIGYERWNSKDPRSAKYTLPTDLERAGDFSQSYNVEGGLRTIYDPWSTRLDANGNAIRTAFPGNRIPSNRIDPTAARFLQDVWAPNNPGDDITRANNFREAYQWTTDFWNVTNRTDYYINDKWRVFGRYSQFKNRIDEIHTVNTPAVPRDEGGNMFALNLAGDVVYTHSSSMIVNFRGSYGSIQDDYYSPEVAVNNSTLGGFWPTNWFEPYTKDLANIFYPHLQVGDNYFGHREYWIEHPKNASAQFKIAHFIGRHNLKYGLSYRRNFGLINYPYPMMFQFGPEATAATFQNPDTALSGDPWASFLLGAIDDNSFASYVSPYNLTIHSWGLYVQDDIKISPRLTLNVGLRWEYDTPPVDAENRLSRGLDLSVPIPEMQGANAPQIPAAVTAIAKIPYQFNGAWQFTTDKDRTPFSTSKKNFMPRLGAAFRINDTSSIRGGWSRFVIPASLTSPLQSDSLRLYGYTAQTNVAPLLEGVPQARLSDPFPSTFPLILPQGKSLGRYQNLGDDVSFPVNNLTTGVSDRFNVSYQRRLPLNFIMDLTYFLNYSTNLPYTRNLNLLNPALSYEFKGLLNQSVDNPFYNFSTPDKFPGTLRNQEQVTIGSLLRPYPQYGTIQQLFTPGAKSRFQAMTIRLQRQYRNGASLLMTYGYNRQSDTQFFNSDAEYANERTWIPYFLPRHRMSISGTYDLPFGSGRRFGSSLHPILNGVLGGWSTSGLALFTTGSFARFNAMQAVGDPLNDVPEGRYWNPAAFKVQPPFTPRTNPWQYAGVTGPNNWNIDATLSKFFPITERFRLEFKLEAYTLANNFVPTNPVTSVTSSNFGRSIDQANRGREMQYTVRLHF